MMNDREMRKTRGFLAKLNSSATPRSVVRRVAINWAIVLSLYGLAAAFRQQPSAWFLVLTLIVWGITAAAGEWQVPRKPKHAP
jgi:hypothetical protein